MVGKSPGATIENQYFKAIGSKTSDPRLPSCIDGGAQPQAFWERRGISVALTCQPSARRPSARARDEDSGNRGWTFESIVRKKRTYFTSYPSFANSSSRAPWTNEALPGPTELALTKSIQL